VRHAPGSEGLNVTGNQSGRGRHKVYKTAINMPGTYEIAVRLKNQNRTYGTVDRGMVPLCSVRCEGRTVGTERHQTLG
jgi:hypothetical protein